MLNKQGFNAWAKSYEKKVYASYKKDIYPFSGYYDVLYEIYQTVIDLNPKKVLDIGVGTGLLASVLYNENIKIYGMDFSDAMLKHAKMRMYNATLRPFDMNEGLHPDLKDVMYDVIVSTYTMHHLPIQKQLDFIRDLKHNLTDKGIIIIGDIMFKDEKHKNTTKNHPDIAWDNEEFYLVYETVKDRLPKHTFKVVSDSAGILIFT
ncbi:MAG: class I SAM-dependent methyltransferase [Bacillota bacterium]